MWPRPRLCEKLEGQTGSRWIEKETPHQADIVSPENAMKTNPDLFGHEFDGRECYIVLELAEFLFFLFIFVELPCGMKWHCAVRKCIGRSVEKRKQTWRIYWYDARNDRHACDFNIKMVCSWHFPLPMPFVHICLQNILLYELVLEVLSFFFYFIKKTYNVYQLWLWVPFVDLSYRQHESIYNAVSIL